LSAEIIVMVVFVLLLLAATAAGVPEIARPMTTLDYIDAIVMSFLSMLLVTIWVGKRIDSAFVLHGALIGAFGVLLFTVLWVATTDALSQPAPYVAAHAFKIIGGIVGGRIAEKRSRTAERA
jgi:putative membrane protein (TIGR04086 family)